MKKVNFNNYSKDYISLMKQQHSKFGGIDYYSKHKAKITKQVFPDDGVNILEFGCGIGRNIPFIKAEYPSSSIFGYDISKNSIDVAKKNNPDVVFFSNLNNARLCNKIDLIFIAGVYHHIHPKLRENISKQIYRLLSNKGIVICFEHNPYNPITRHMVNTCEFDEDAVLLNRKELSNSFKNQGLTHYKSSYILFFPEKLKKLNFIEKYLCWVPFGGQYSVSFHK